MSDSTSANIPQSFKETSGPVIPEDAESPTDVFLCLFTNKLILPVNGQKVRCARCSTRSKPHRNRWHCSTCHVGLCLTDKSNCFYAFHKKNIPTYFPSGYVVEPHLFVFST